MPTPPPSPRQALATRLVETFPALGEAPPAVLERIVDRSLHRKVPAGTVMFSDRSPCSGFPLVLDGTIRVLQRYPNGRELQLYRVKPGESCLLSGSCLLGHSDYAASGITETAAELLILPADEFRALIAQDETFRTWVFAQYGERLATMMKLVEAITYQKLDQRLASRLAERVRSGERTIHATHQGLADELGSVREIVSRLLRSFEDRGWVELGRESIVVRDPEALAELAKS